MSSPPKFSVPFLTAAEVAGLNAPAPKIEFLPYNPPAQVPVPGRDKILTTAGNLISGQRAKDYGDAAENFQRIADLWAPILRTTVTAEQVALCLVQLKVSRLITSPSHEDSWVDACGYLALGGEIAGNRTEKEMS